MNDQLLAAIFDLDGTLVDTMPIHYQAYRQAFAEHGIDFGEADYYDHVGGNAASAIPRFLRGRPLDVPVTTLHDRKKVIVAELLQSAPIRVLPTARLLPILQDRLRLAVASSGSRPGIEIVLARLGWRELFQALVTGEDTTRGKPAPDPFLLAAERVGVAPPSCIVFEDTDDGVAGARAAGMQVFDVRG